MKKRKIFLLVLTLGLTVFISLFPENELDELVTHLNLDEEAILYPFFYYVTFLGSKNVIIPFVLLGGAYLFKRYKQVYPSLMLILGTLVGYLTNEGIKLVIQRPRPTVVEAVHATGYSFPSGHSMTSFITYFIFVYFLMLDKDKNKRQKTYILTAIIVLLIGFTRLVLQVHYLTDVLGGFLFGWLYLLLVFKLFPRTKYLKRKE